ncbi:hypothetical protein MJG53_003636 [Ovis ammon polii x Ovis aries]|uniref:Uncharacterized protein n=1 Tax=Ovis ammon polii x Ovis aries TaxID=2918886 RepID=A0ACB9VHK5_9CETA|nr:hypothetical protein MJG53_003636 [Ovis ammon polii x Ovis aries]
MALLSPQPQPRTLLRRNRVEWQFGQFPWWQFWTKNCEQKLEKIDLRSLGVALNLQESLPQFRESPNGHGASLPPPPRLDTPYTLSPATLTTVGLSSALASSTNQPLRASSTPFKCAQAPLGYELMIFQEKKKKEAERSPGTDPGPAVGLDARAPSKYPPRSVPVQTSIRASKCDENSRWSPKVDPELKTALQDHAKNIWLAQHSTGLVIINQYMLIDPAGPRVPAQKDEFFSNIIQEPQTRPGKSTYEVLTYAP